MKKINNQKGITLIALIITIITLLILAVVTISAVQNDGIVRYAQNATEIYNFTEGLEEDRINSYSDFVNKYATGSTDGENSGEKPEEPTESMTWTQSGSTVTSNTGITLNLGDKVYSKSLSYSDYTAGNDSDNGWGQVFGVKNEKLVLLACIGADGLDKVGEEKEASWYNRYEPNEEVSLDDINYLKSFNPTPGSNLYNMIYPGYSYFLNTFYETREAENGKPAGEYCCVYYIEGTVVKSYTDLWHKEQNGYGNLYYPEQRISCRKTYSVSTIEQKNGQWYEKE